MSTIGVVGLGLLGHAIASRLIAAKHRVIGHDVVSARGDALNALGGEAAVSVGAVAKSADVVCTILPSLDAISPTLTERLAREVTAHGVGFLDCPISGTSGMVERGQGVIFVGGERALFDRWEPVLASVLARPVYIGRAGQAMTLKLVANLLVALHSAAAAEALVMARQAGLDLGLVLEVLGAGAATSRMLEVRGPLIAKGEFPPQMKLDLFMKDLHLIQDAARTVGAPLPLTDVAERLYASVNAEGHGGEDLSVVVRELERMTGAKG